MTWRSKWFALAALALALAACRIEDTPDLPITDHVALCCKSSLSPGSPLAFTGCRQTNHCRSSETVWVRGPVECGPVDIEACAGGRCCALHVQAPELEPEPEPMIAKPVPEPAAIEPMPFESR